MKNSETQLKQLPDDTYRWYAIYTGYKREKVVKTSLEKQGINVFLPLKTAHRQWGRKKKTVELPLINGYLFVNITKNNYIPVLRTPNVVTFLKIGKILESIPDNQIDILRRVIGEDLDIDTCSETLTKGDAVEIIAGNLIGIKGRMVEIKGKNKFVIRLDRMGFDLHLELPNNLVRPINDKKLEYI